MELIQQIAAALGVVFVAGGTCTGLALWLFKLFGEKWLSNRFAERLEAFKHDQQKEIERLRFEISKLLDRTTKLNQREFDTLPEAWDLAAKSYHAVRGMAVGIHSYPDISRMTEAQFEEFLVKCPLEDWQKDELRKGSDRTRYYQNAIIWHELSEVRDACRKSAFFLLKNGIFMPPKLRTKFQQLEDLAWSTFIEHETNQQYKTMPQGREELKKVLKEGAPLMKELECKVQERLWGSPEEVPSA